MSRPASPDRRPAHEVTIDDGHAGQRLDNFLATYLKGLPRTRLYRLIRRGEVRVNKGRARQHYRLAAGDRVRIPPVRIDSAGETHRPNPSLLEDLERRIVLEDRDLLVLDKPSGLAVHGGSGLAFGAIECIRAMRPTEQRIELAHRLDRDTSGCLVFAKRRDALVRLHGALRDGRINKRYTLLARGAWGRRLRFSDARLKRVEAGGERFVIVDRAGRESLTRYSVIRRSKLASLVTAMPVTGRTHQIRVHALAEGHPIAGDAKYGDPGFNREMRDLGLRRLFLHATSLEIPDWTDGRPLTVTAPLPAELQRIAERACPPPARGERMTAGRSGAPDVNDTGWAS